MDLLLSVSAFALGLAGGMCLAGLVPTTFVPQKYRGPVGALLVGVGLGLAIGI